MKYPGIYFVGWESGSKDRVWDECCYKVYALVDKEVVFIGGYKTIEEAEEAATWQDT